ncbi:MAG: acylphosphatase [Rhodospirillaceae bacterium]|nr:acylphosphatase [Rhodospirillaceae bacterium]
MNKNIYKLVIIGKVQGVFYRAWLKETAQKIGLNGYVYNKINGSVEALVICKKDELDRLVKLCYEGSELSCVKKVEYFILNNFDFSNFSDRFFIKY